MRYHLAIPALLLAGATLAAEPPALVTLSKEQAAGSVWQEHQAVEKTEDGVTTADIELFRTKENDFDAGVWRSGEAHWDIDGYPYNEYIQVLEGSITLTSTDGTAAEIGPGDSVLIPLGWKGRWDSPGVTKIYVIHAPNKDL